MKILLTNDDGIEAPGLTALAEILKDEECLIVAPTHERSASSHSISLGQKLLLEARGPFRYAVNGTPADCVKLALSELRNFTPDLLISGINPGPNTGVSVYYSGTISAAREALINQIPAMAISVGNKTPDDFSYAAQFTRDLLKGYETGVFPKNVLLNVNIPALPESEIRGIRIARQAPSRFVEEFIRESESDGQRIYRLAGEIQVFDPDGTTDQEVLSQGFISITPLQLDQTDYSAFSRLEQWFQKNS